MASNNGNGQVSAAGQPRFTKQGAIGMTVAQWADVVTIEVGPGRAKSTIPRFLARETSQVFQRRFEDRTRRIKRLPDEDAWVFTIYAVYMYTGSLSFNGLGWPQPQDDATGWQTLVRVYMLGKALEDKYFLKLVRVLLNELTELSWELEHTFFGPPLDDINLLYANVPARDSIHEAFAAFWAIHATRARYKAVEGVLHPDFRRDLLYMKLTVRDHDAEQERTRQLQEDDANGGA